MTIHTLRSAYEAFIEPAQMRAAGTASATRTAISHIERLVPEVSCLAVSGLRSIHLSQFKAAWVREGERTPQTFNKCLRHIKALLNELHELELIDTVPRCRALREVEPRVRVISDREVRAIYDSCAKARWPCRAPYPAPLYWRALVVTAYTTGLRRRDILAIRWSDIDEHRRVLITRQQKTGKLRAIPLHRNTIRHLSRLRSEGTDVLFYSTRSNHQFYRQWHDIQFDAGIEEHYGIHDLRRTCGSVVYERSGLHAASELLAHSSLSVTRRHYIASGVVAESLRSAIEEMPQPFDC